MPALELPDPNPGLPHVEQPLSMSIVTKVLFALTLMILYCPILEGIGIIYSIFVYAWSRVLVSESSDYGAIAVTRTRIGQRILLMNDGVIHSVHRKGEATPEGYCYPGSGAADVFLQQRMVPDDAQVALIGLGAGALLSYARKGQRWFCYEINPSVVKLAANQDLFGFLAACPAEVTIRCEDGFSAIGQLQSLDVIIVDTFFGDRNVGSQAALETPIRNSDGDCLFLLHVSGLSDQDIAAIAQTGVSCGFTSIIKETPSQDRRLGRCPLNDFRYPFRMPSKWVVMSRTASHISTLALLPEWKQV